MAGLNILISGGGIAGNALAFWLSKGGHNVTIVERFPTLRTTGLQIDLRGHGREVLRRMGLEQEGLAKTVPEQGMKLVDTWGKLRAYFPVNRSGKGVQSLSTEFEIMREDLCRLLYDAAKDKTKYIFGQSIQGFVEHEKNVEVTFTDGRTEMYDLLVGADGVYSRTRRLLLGPDSKDAVHPLGVQISYFTIPEPNTQGEEYNSTVYFAGGKRMIMTRRHNEESLQVYMNCQSESDEWDAARKLGTEEQKAVVTRVFKGAGWRVDDFLRGLKDTENFYCESLTLVDMDSWHSRHVALLGDAAYCPTATTAMGTTSALVGAYILAGEISEFCGPTGSRDAVDRALKEYDRKFRPFMTQVQRGVVEGSFWDWMPASTFGVFIMYIMFAMVSFLKLNVIGEIFLREGGVKDFSLPDYKRMVQSAQQSEHDRS